MVIHDQPAPVTIPVDKAEPRRTTGRFAFAVLRKRVGPAVDGSVTIDANSLLPHDSLVRRRNGAQYVEVLTNGGRIVTKCWRPGAPQHRFRVIEQDNSLGIVAIHGSNPCLRRRSNILLGTRQR